MEKLSTAVLVWAEHHTDGHDQTLMGASGELLHLARQITSGPVIAVTGASTVDTESIGSAGVATIYQFSGDQRSWRDPVATAQGLSQAVEEISKKQEVGGVLVPSTFLGRQVAAHLGAKLGSGVATDVTGIEIENGLIRASKNVLGGGWETSFSMDNSRIPVLAVSRANILDDAVESVVPDCIKMEADPQLQTPEVRLVSSERSSGDSGNNLAEAKVVVVGGRGTDGDFDLVEEFAVELDGAVGATRVACDEGWIDRSAQIGQTGLSIAPNIYVGLGVSGAIHHTCGMQGSAVITAVCDDPDASIFEMANFGIIGDVQEVIPQALEELRRLKAE